MKAVGAIAIVIAAILGLASWNNYEHATNLEKQIKGFDPIGKLVYGIASGGSDEVKRHRDLGFSLFIGAAVLGVVGLALCGGASEENDSTKKQAKKA